jgi:hypothetical protein
MPTQIHGVEGIALAAKSLGHRGVATAVLADAMDQDHDRPWFGRRQPATNVEIQAIACGKAFFVESGHCSCFATESARRPRFANVRLHPQIKNYTISARRVTAYDGNPQENCKVTFSRRVLRIRGIVILSEAKDLDGMQGFAPSYEILRCAQDDRLRRLCSSLLATPGRCLAMRQNRTPMPTRGPPM